MTVSRYTGNETMSPWPGLAPYARQIGTGDGTIFFYDTEENPLGLSLVCIHGLGDEADSFRHIIPFLRRSYRVLSVDLPGFGRSVSRKRATLKNHAAALGEILRLIGGPAVLAGSSMGAIIAEAAACSHAGQVKAIILLDGVFPSAAKPDPGLLLMALPFLGKRWYRAFRKDHDAAYRSLFPYYADIRELSAADREFLRKRVIDRVESEKQLRAYFSSLRSMIFFSLFPSKSFTGKIKSYPGKIMVGWGEKDSVMPRGAAEILMKLRPDIYLVEFPGAGHLPHQEKPAAVADAILRFLSGNP